MEERQETGGVSVSFPSAKAIGSRYREITGVRRWICSLFTIVVIVAAILYLFRLSPFGYTFVDKGYLYFFIAFILPQTFILFPGRRGMVLNVWPWYDKLAFGFAFIVPFYLFLKAYEITYGAWEAVCPFHTQVMSMILIILMIEGARRSAGWILPILCALFAFYPLIAEHMPGPLEGLNQPFWDLMAFHVVGNEGIIGIPTTVVATLLIGFLLFATALQATGGGRFFFEVAMGLLGHVRGGPAKVAVLSSGLFGSISGSVNANVLTTGSVTIPTMKQTGYPSYYAGAIEACASTGGVLMPPIMGATAFVMAQFLGIPYGRIVIAAVVPSILYYLCLFLQADAFAVRNSLSGLPREELPSVLKAIKERGWYIFIGLAVLLYVLLVMIQTAQAPFYSVAVFFILPMLRKSSRLHLKDVVVFLENTSRLLADMLATIGSIGLIISSLIVTGAASAMSSVLLELAGGNTILILLFGGIVSFMLGMGMTVTAVYVILALVLCPSLVDFGLNTIAVHLFVLYTAMLSFITPPVAIGAFIGSIVAGSSFMKTGFTAMRLGIAMYLIPFLFVLQPGIILQNFSFMNTVVPLGTALFGIVFISWAAEGYMLKVGELGWLVRILFFSGGVLSAWPGWKTNIIGACLVFIPLGFMVLKRTIFGSKQPEAELG
jgi:TRAP transporter 4TM/12TM fusion protein